MRSYALNSWVGYSSVWDPRLGNEATYKVVRKANQITAPGPSSLLTFIDVQPDSICRPHFGITMGPPGTETFFNYPASAHDGGGAVSFADGHVEAHHWKDPRTVAAKSVDFHAHNDKSPGNEDIRWLQQHATSSAAPP